MSFLGMYPFVKLLGKLRAAGLISILWVRLQPCILKTWGLLQAGSAIGA